MYCPYCGTQNADTNKFCLNCGSQLPGQNVIVPGPGPVNKPPIVNPPPILPILPADPVSQAATIGGISSIAGGGFTVLGWFVPWFSLGGLVSSALSLLDIGTGFNLFKFGSGVGNGLQTTLLAITAGLAGFVSGEELGILFGLLSLAFAAVFVSIPIMAISVIRSGFKAFEAKQAGDPEYELSRSQNITDHLGNVRSKSTTIFVILVVIFLLLAAVPFGTAVLGGGFYLTLMGTLVSFFGAYFAKSKINR